MSLRYLSRNCVRMAQQVMREHGSKPVQGFKAAPASSSSQPGVAAANKARQPESGQVMKRSAVPASAAKSSEAAAATTRRKAEKDENVMHLVCWGPN